MLYSILQFIGGAACLTVALFEARLRKKKKKIPARFNWITLFGGLVVIGSVLVADFGNDKFKKEEDKKTDILVGEKNCYIIFYGNPFKQEGHVCFRSKMMRMGELPIYDINIMLFDMSKLIPDEEGYKSVSKARFINTSYSSQNLLVGTLSGGIHELPLVVTTMDQDFYLFYILISTRNGSVRQEQYFKQINGTWETASLVYDCSTNGLQEKILSANFPESVIDSISNILK